MRVLLIDDRKDLGTELKKLSKSEDVILDWATETGGARQALKDDTYEAVILADTLDDGISQEILGGRITGLLGLTAGGADERIAMLRKGYDDALSAPYSLREILVRTSSVMGRWRGRAKQLVTIGHATLDYGFHKLYVDGMEVTCTTVMWHILSVAFRNPGTVFNEDSVLASGVSGRGRLQAMYRVRWRLRAWGHGDIFHVPSPSEFCVEDRNLRPHASTTKDRIKYLKNFIRTYPFLVCPNDYRMLQMLLDDKTLVLKEKPKA